MNLRHGMLLWAGVGLASGCFLIDPPHRDVAAEACPIQDGSRRVGHRSGLRGLRSQAPYLNAVVELYGVVAEDDGQRVTLKGGVIAAWDTTRAHRTLEEGELLKLKGRVTGYDDLFEEVRMDGLVLIEDTP